MTEDTEALLSWVCPRVLANGDYATARALELLLRGAPLVNIIGGVAHLADGLTEDLGIVRDWDNEEA